MIRGYLTIAVMSIVLAVAAQPGTIVPANIRAINNIERLTYLNSTAGNEMIYGVPVPEGKVIGDTYLHREWKRSAILLYAGEKLIEGFPVRYDIRTDELEVKTSGGIKALEGRNVRSFTWIDSLRTEPYFFINAKEFKNEGVQMAGFMEVLVDGKLPLLKKINISIKKADYNVALSVGSRDDKILKQPAYFVFSEKVGELKEIPGSKKKLMPVFQTKAEEMEKYIGANDLSVKKEEDLIKIITHYNRLLNANP